MTAARSRILVVNANWLGDILFSTPALRALKKKYPHSHITCLAPVRTLEALRGNPHLNEVLVYNERGGITSPMESLRVIRLLKRRRFDTAIFFHRSKSKVFLAKLAGIPERFGYSNRGKRFLTQAVKMPVKAGHRIDFYLDLVARMGVPPDGRHMEFVPQASAEKKLEALLRESGIQKREPYAVVHAGGNWEMKRWPVGHFAEAIQHLNKEFGFKMVLCGSSSEEPLAREIQSRLTTGQVVSLCGKTSLDTLAVLLKKSEFLLSNDSGPIHLAATQKTRILGLFGPTSPSLTGPVSQGPVRILWKDVGCAVPCYFRSCDTRVCMDWLKVSEVMEEARKLMREPL